MSRELQRSGVLSESGISHPSFLALVRQAYRVGSEMPSSRDRSGIDRWFGGSIFFNTASLLSGEYPIIGSLSAPCYCKSLPGKKLERICRYISRPALSEARLELTDQGMVRYALKSAYLRGTIGMGLLGGNPTRCVRSIGFYGQTGSVGTKASHQPDGAVQVRFHGVLVRGGLPYNSRYRDRVTPIRCGKLKKLSADGNAEVDGLSELSTMLFGRLAKYKLPQRFVFLDEMPKTGYGKVTKRLIKEVLETQGLLTKDAE